MVATLRKGPHGKNPTRKWMACFIGGLSALDVTTREATVRMLTIEIEQVSVVTIDDDDGSNGETVDKNDNEKDRVEALKPAG